MMGKHFISLCVCVCACACVCVCVCVYQTICVRQSLGGAVGVKQLV